MSLDQFFAMLAFSFAMSATPGPNTMMLFASGVNYGVSRTYMHMLGIPFGLTAMLLACGLGLGTLIQASPRFGTALKVGGVLYMLWLAWGIAKSGTIKDGQDKTEGRPLTMLEGALFQWVNPKAWAMALTGVSAYTVPERYSASLAILMATMFVISFPICLAWTGAGVSLRRFLEKPGRLRLFNVTMALLLVASLWPIMREWLG